MSGPIFVVELEHGIFITGYYYPKKFTSEISAQSALNCARRTAKLNYPFLLDPYPDAKIILVDDE